MKIFLDTNIVIDYMAAREPFCKIIRPIFRECTERRFELMVASMTFTTMEYVLKKHVDHSLLMNKFSNLRQIVEVIPTDGEIIDNAIASIFKDFEDAVQHYTAIAGNAEVIITRNTADFIPYNDISVLTPQEFTDKYMQ